LAEVESCHKQRAESGEQNESRARHEHLKKKYNRSKVQEYSFAPTGYRDGLEVETVAEDQFGDEVIGGAGNADAHSEIDFPLGRKIEVDRGENLVFLKSDGVEIGGGPYGAIVFEATGDFLAEVAAEFEVGREDETLIFGKAVHGFVESGIEGKIPAADLLINDRSHLPGPGIHGILAALVADFIGETEADGPFPLGRDADARANVVADPVNAETAFFGGEDVEADFEPVGKAVSDFDGFVKLVVGGKHAVKGGFGALKSEVAVELDHGMAGFDGVGRVDLNFVVVLRVRKERKNREHNENAKGTKRMCNAARKPQQTSKKKRTQ